MKKNPRHGHGSGLVLLMLCSAVSVGVAQDDGAAKTYYENLSLDPEGRICYMEALGNDPLSRIEYRSNGRFTLDLVFVDGARRTKIEASDLDGNGTADLIYVEQDAGERDVEIMSLYRGPAYREHLKRHFDNALRTSTYPLIKSQPEEQKRAKRIQSDLDSLDQKDIGPMEMGIYMPDLHFHPNQHREIQYAFMATDTLSNVLGKVTKGDFRLLSRKADIAKKYHTEIDMLLTLDPKVMRMESQ